MTPDPYFFLIIFVGVALVSWFVMQAVLCSYFYERLARATELKLGTPAHELVEVPLWPSIHMSTHVLVPAGNPLWHAPFCGVAPSPQASSTIK